MKIQKVKEDEGERIEWEKDSHIGDQCVCV